VTHPGERSVDTVPDDDIPLRPWSDGSVRAGRGARPHERCAT